MKSNQVAISEGMKRWWRRRRETLDQKSMTPNQYRTALEALGLTQERAALFLGVSVRTSHGYANGSPIPEGCAKLLRLMIRLKLNPEDVK